MNLKLDENLPAEIAHDLRAGGQDVQTVFEEGRMPYRCATCGQEHDELPDIGADRPDVWWSIPEDERARRIKLTTDTCVVDDELFLIRGVLRIPLTDEPQVFGFGVWVSQKRENFEKYLANFHSAKIGPFFGWLCTSIRYYEGGTEHLKTMAYFQDGNQRPHIVVEPTDHPLAIDQREGITLAKAWEIVHFYGPKQ